MTNFASSLFLLIIYCTISYQQQNPPPWSVVPYSEGAYENSNNNPPDLVGILCAISGLPPRPTKYDFPLCRQYESLSCCNTGHASNAYDAWQSIVDVGDSCPYKRQRKAPELVEFLCMPCDPLQPNYTVTNYTDGFQLGTTYVRICSDFAQRLWSRANYYGECGLNYGNFPCGSNFETCDSRIVMPALYANAENFMNAMPNTFTLNGHYYMLVVNESTLKPGELCFSGGNHFVSLNFVYLFLILTVVLKFL